MKNLILILFVCCGVLSTACEKENCRDAILGTYGSTQMNSSSSTKIKLVIHTGNEEKDVFVVFSKPSLNFPDLTFLGSLNLDCSVVIIPSQTISSHVISGSLSINKYVITGTLYLDGSPNIINCSK